MDRYTDNAVLDGNILKLKQKNRKNDGTIENLADVDIDLSALKSSIGPRWYEGD